MKVLAKFGQGKHKVTFFWDGADRRQYGVTYQAGTRKGVARIMHGFRAGMNAVRRERYNGKDLFEIACKSTPYGYKWLAAQSPHCKIKTTRKDGRPTTLIYSFHYEYCGYMTWQGIQRRVGGLPENLHSIATDNQNYTITAQEKAAAMSN